MQLSVSSIFCLKMHYKGQKSQDEAQECSLRGPAEEANLSMRRNHCKTYMKSKIFEAGDTRLGAEGAETTVTYAKNWACQKGGNRKDHSQILAL